MKTLVEIKPWVSAGHQGLTYADDELYFDWTAFKVPKGCWELIQFHYLTRPSGLTGHAVNTIKSDFYFAKPSRDGSAPTSLGTVNAALATPGAGSAVNLYGNLVSKYLSVSQVVPAVSDSTTIVQSSLSSKDPFFLCDNGLTEAGYDTYYVAAITDGANDHRSGLLVNNGSLTTDKITVDGVDPRDFLVIGDEIITEDNAEIGTIKAMPDANTILLEKATKTTLENDHVIYPKNPITIRLFLEN